MDAQAHLQQRALEVPPGSLRQTVLLAAKRFKSSWVELGRLLARVHAEGLHDEWGFPSFDAYCLGELRIRRQTAEKLLRSFGFLERHEPERMASPRAQEEAPPFEVVEVLAQAEGRGQLSKAEYASVRDSIWNPEKPQAELRRELTERFPAPQSAASDMAVVKRLWGQSKRLAAELRASPKVPDAVAERAEALAADLEALLTQHAEA